MFSTSEPPQKRRRLNIGVPVTGIKQNATGDPNTNKSLMPQHMQFPDNNDNSGRTQQLDDFKLQLTNLLQMFPPLADLLAVQKDQQQALSELYAVFASSQAADSMVPMPTMPTHQTIPSRVVPVPRSPLHAMHRIISPVIQAPCPVLPPQRQPVNAVHDPSFPHQPLTFSILPIHRNPNPNLNPPTPPSVSVLPSALPLPSNVIPPVRLINEQFRLALPVIGNASMVQNPVHVHASPNAAIPSISNNMSSTASISSPSGSVSYPKSDGSHSLHSSDTVTTCSAQTPRIPITNTSSTSTTSSSSSSSGSDSLIVPTNPSPNVNVAVISKFCFETVPDSKQVGIYCIAEDVLKTVKTKEIGLIRKRVDLRIHRLIKVINNSMVRVVKRELQPFDESSNVLKSFGLNVRGTPDARTESNLFRFDDALQRQITQRIVVKLAQWHGGRYRSRLKDEKDCYNKTRTYWNRQKAQQLGDELFAPVLILTFQFVMKQGQWTLRDRVLTFIDIFLGLCAETIQFDRSMARPLVLNACYFKTNKWKDCCDHFIHCFGRNVHWETVKATRSMKQGGKTVYTYVRDDNRSQYLHDDFLRILKKIHGQITNDSPSDTSFIQLGVERFTKWFSESLIHSTASPLLQRDIQNLFPGKSNRGKC